MSDSVLSKYLPNSAALNYIQKWIAPYSVQILITRGRKAKLGDYRRLKKKYDHKITINYDLHPELFFLTLTHEIAHMMVYHKLRFKKIKPHGPEWKNIFSAMIVESLEVYSDELQILLKHFSKNPKAGYYGDAQIAAYFAKQENSDQLLLMNLIEGMSFSIENTPYRLLKKNRTRYLCKNLINQRQYLINHSVSVEKLAENESK